MPTKRSTKQSARSPTTLSRRERQIMDAIYTAGPSSAANVRAALHDAPSYSAIRALLRILEDKGHLTHSKQNGRYVYTPTRSRGVAAKSAMRQVLQTFFDNSAAKAVAALMDVADAKLNEQELNELSQLIDRARK